MGGITLSFRDGQGQEDMWDDVDGIVPFSLVSFRPWTLKLPPSSRVSDFDAGAGAEVDKRGVCKYIRSVRSVVRISASGRRGG